MRDSWRRKVRIGRSKGVSTVIGAIFFVIITLLITTNIFLWSIAQHNQYNQAVIQSNQMDSDRINERITITNGNYSVASPQVRVKAILTNEGPVPSRILTLWVVATGIDGVSRYNYLSLSSPEINLAPGNETRIDKSVTIAGCQASDDYEIWFVTARGNRISFEKKQYVTVVNIIQAMGPIQISFNSIKWRSMRDGTFGTYEIKYSTSKVLWSIDVTNYGVQDITLTEDSAFRVSDLSGHSGRSQVWYLGEPGIPNIYEYTIPVGKTVTIRFYWESPGDDDPVDDKVSESVGTYPAIVCLIGNYVDGTHFGQTIPFESIKVTWY